MADSIAAAWTLLGCPDVRSRSLATARRAFIRAALVCHPDKKREQDDGKDFVRLSDAWNLVRQSCAEGKRAPEVRGDAHEHVDWSELSFDADEGAFVWDCRCGDRVLASLEAIDAQVEIFECQSCSIRLGVSYAAS